jgi:hypothetical protein
MSDEERQEAIAKLRDERQAQQKETKDKINEVLSSRQRTRFSELEFQFALQQGDVSGALAAAGVELSEADQEKLDETREELTQELRQRIAKLQQETNSEILGSALDSGRISQLAGDAFEFDASAGPRFGRGGGGGEQRGGGRAARRADEAEQEEDAGDGERPASRRRRRE